MSLVTAKKGGLATRLRVALEAMDADVALTLVDLGLTGYRPKYSVVVRYLARSGPSSIRDIAAETGVTHSAASQTVNEMVRGGFLELRAGSDARERLASLAPRVEAALPAIDAEWAATEVAATSLDAELSAPLHVVVAELEAALAARPFRQRIADAAADVPMSRALRKVIGRA